MDDAINYLQSSHPSLLGNDAPDVATESAEEVSDNQPLRAVMDALIKYHKIDVSMVSPYCFAANVADEVYEELGWMADLREDQIDFVKDSLAVLKFLTERERVGNAPSDLEAAADLFLALDSRFEDLIDFWVEEVDEFRCILNATWLLRAKRYLIFHRLEKRNIHLLTSG